MVLLTVTAAAKAAINEFCRLKEESNDAVGDEITTKTNELSEIRLGSPIDHSDLIKISQFLVQESRQRDEETAAKVWRLDALLRGADVYQPPPPPKPEPVTRNQAHATVVQYTEFEYRHPNTRSS